MNTLVLASASPRRRELLAQLGLQFVVTPSDIDESQHAQEEPMVYVARLAREKAMVHATPDRCVLGADTVVTLLDEPRILGKPGDREGARRMLERLSDKSHTVITATHLQWGDIARARVVQSEVRFAALSTADIEAYLDCNEWHDKAGGYAIQGLAGAFVVSISGSYSNIVGLPLCEVVQDLRAIGAVPTEWGIGRAC